MYRSVECIVLAIVSLFAIITPIRAAILDGQIVQTSYFRGISPDQTVQIGPVDSLVGPGVELTNFADFLNVNFSDTNILMTATRNANALSSFELIRFFNVTGLIPVITDVTINPATNFTGFNASRITFDANLISVNLTALAGLQNQQISLNLSAVPRAPGPPPPPPPPPTPQAEIPEPGSAPLCAMGVVIIVTLAKGKI